MALKFDHIVIPCWNAGASLAFYRDVMGFALTHTISGEDWGGYPWLMMLFRAGDGHEIVLVALRGAKRPKHDGLPRDARHLAFAEKSIATLQAWREKLRVADIAFTEETHGRQRSLYFQSPEGTMLEITAPPTRVGKSANRAALASARKWIKGP